MKLLFFSALFSFVLFFALVSLGIKYHWVKLYQHKTPEQLKLVLPDSPGIKINDPRIVDENSVNGGIEIDKSAFEAAILEQEQVQNPFSAMTKQQVQAYCRNYYKAGNLSQQQKILLVADCVLKNYQDDYQELATSDDTDFRNANFSNGQSEINQGGSKTALNSSGRQNKIRMQAISQQCSTEINKQIGLSDKEKQLLIQTCITDLNKRTSN